MVLLNLSQNAPQAPAAPVNDPAAGNDLIKDSGLSTFATDVLEASLQVPVIVDFWAPWCGPCKQLAPVLEKTVRALKGAVRMVKIDIDKNPEIAQQMRIQSIPAVFAFFQGRPVDGFMGALPEGQIKQWLEKLLKATGGGGGSNPLAEIAEAMRQAEECLAQGDGATAQAIYADVLERDPANAAAYAGIIRCYLGINDIASARKMYDAAPEALCKDKAFDIVRAALEVADQAAQAEPASELQAKVAANPKDHQARLDLALALLAGNQREAAVDQLLEMIRLDRKWNEEAARKQLVKLFEAFGPADPLTISARRRLSSILFS